MDKKALEIVKNYVLEHLDKSDELLPFDIYIRNRNLNQNRKKPKNKKRSLFCMKYENRVIIESDGEE